MINPSYFKHIYVYSGIWESMGWSAIIYIAALAGVNVGLYEARKSIFNKLLEEALAKAQSPQSLYSKS